MLLLLALLLVLRLLPPQCCCCSSSMLLRLLLLLLLVLLSCSSRSSPPRSFSDCRPLVLSLRRPPRRSVGRSVLETLGRAAAAAPGPWMPPSRASPASATMGKRGNRSAACSAGDGDYWAAPGAEDDDLTSRVRRWKSEHPARDYGGQPLQHVQPSDGLGSGTLVVRSVRCGVYSRTRDGQFAGDVVWIPMAQRTRSVDRTSALAATHPLAATLVPHAKLGWSERVRDSRGRAKDGFDQSPYHLSVSLAGHGGGKTMYMGLTTKGVRDKDMFGLWWHRAGPDWTDAHISAARQLFFDVCELDVQSVFPMDEADRPSTGGDPTAASGALAGSGGEEPTEVERKETVRRREPTYLVDLEESHSAKESDSSEETNSDSSANDSSHGS